MEVLKITESQMHALQYMYFELSFLSKECSHTCNLYFKNSIDGIYLLDDTPYFYDVEKNIPKVQILKYEIVPNNSKIWKLGIYSILSQLIKSVTIEMNEFEYIKNEKFNLQYKIYGRYGYVIRKGKADLVCYFK